MIEVNGNFYPESAVKAVTGAGTRDETITFTDGRRVQGLTFHWIVIPNATKVKALVVWLDESGCTYTRDLPVAAWRINGIGQSTVYDYADPILAGPVGVNEAFCLYQMDDNGDAFWIPDEADFANYKAAVAYLADRLKKDAEARAQKLQEALHSRQG